MCIKVWDIRPPDAPSLPTTQVISASLSLVLKATLSVADFEGPIKVVGIAPRRVAIPSAGGILVCGSEKDGQL